MTLKSTMSWYTWNQLMNSRRGGSQEAEDGGREVGHVRNLLVGSSSSFLVEFVIKILPWLQLCISQVDFPSPSPISQLIWVFYTGPACSWPLFTWPSDPLLRIYPFNPYPLPLKFINKCFYFDQQELDLFVSVRLIYTTYFRCNGWMSS